MELSRTETPDCVASSPINLKMVSSLPLVIVLACFSLLGHLHSRVFVHALQFWPASSDDTVFFSDAFQHDFHKFHISNKLIYCIQLPCSLDQINHKHKRAIMLDIM